MLVILTVLGKSNTGFAQDVIKLEKGEPAPYRGILFDEEQANTLYNEIETSHQKVTSLEKINLLYKDNEELYEKKLNILLTQNVNLTNALSNSEKNKEVSKIIWFAAGVSAVVLGAYATQAVSK